MKNHIDDTEVDGIISVDLIELSRQLPTDCLYNLYISTDDIENPIEKVLEKKSWNELWAFLSQYVNPLHPKPMPDSFHFTPLNGIEKGYVLKNTKDKDFTVLFFVSCVYHSGGYQNLFQILEEQLIKARNLSAVELLEWTRKDFLGLINEVEAEFVELKQEYADSLPNPKPDSPKKRKTNGR